MNFIKIKKIITILMFVACTQACYGAAQSEQRSLWQRTKDFVAAHPIATGLVGSAVAVGAYELAARSLGLSTLDKLAETAFEKIKTDRECQILAASALTAGAYSMVAGRFGLPTITGTMKKDLITGSQGENENPALIYHLLHAFRMAIYSTSLSFIANQTGLYSEERKRNLRAAQENLTKKGLLAVIIWGPILEELVMTYISRWYLGNDDARAVMPVAFGMAHNQYGLFGRLCCAIGSFLRHHSLHMRPEYAYAPILSHIVHNAVSGISLLAADD